MPDKTLLVCVGKEKCFAQVSLYLHGKLFDINEPGTFFSNLGVTLAHLVKASVGQADVQRFEPHLGHNWLSCGVFLCKVQALWAPSGTNHKAKLAISLSGWLGRYTNWSIYKVCS